MIPDLKGIDVQQQQQMLAASGPLTSQHPRSVIHVDGSTPTRPLLRLIALFFIHERLFPSLDGHTVPHRTWHSGGARVMPISTAATLSQIAESCMSELFLTCTLILNNHDWDELDTEQQLCLRLRNKLLLLYFGSGSCDDCRAFTRVLRKFWTRLTDPAHVERAAPLALVYISHDPSADCQRAYMQHSMPSEWLSLRHGDPLASELGRRFEVRVLPSVVVLQPSGEEVTRAGAEEIRRLGEAAFANWREAAEVLDRGFLLAEDFEEVETPFRSLSHHLRRLFYKTEKEKQGPDGFLRNGAV